MASESSIVGAFRVFPRVIERGVAPVGNFPGALGASSLRSLRSPLTRA